MSDKIKVTVEKINGAEYTVVWHEDTELGYWHPTYMGGHEKYLAHVNIRGCDKDNQCRLRHIATALPALPRYPKPKDIMKYYEHDLIIYGESETGDEGIVVASTVNDDCWLSTEGELFPDGMFKVTHANMNGERCEIAIKEM
jgi:hypothetical protein